MARLRCPLTAPCSSNQPASCADWKAQAPASQDGNYTLTLNGTSFTVYCFNMSTPTPTEYIVVNAATNYAQYAGWDIYASGADCDTSYSKVSLAINMVSACPALSPAAMPPASQP